MFFLPQTFQSSVQGFSYAEQNDNHRIKEAAAIFFTWQNIYNLPGNHVIMCLKIWCCTVLHYALVGPIVVIFCACLCACNHFTTCAFYPMVAPTVPIETKFNSGIML